MQRHRTPLALALILLSLLLAASSVPAQRSNQPLDVLIDAWTPLIEIYEQELEGPVTEGRLDEIRLRIEELRAAARAEVPAQTDKAAVAQERLRDLGPPPAEGDDPEADVIVEERQQRGEATAAAQASLRRLELIIAETTRLLDLIGDIRRERFLEQVLKRETSPLMPEIWQQGLPEAQRVIADIANGFGNWLTKFTEAARTQAFLLFLAGLATAVSLSWPVKRWLLRRPIASTDQPDPSYLARIRRAAWVGAVRSLLPVIALLIVYAMLDRRTLLEGGAGKIATSALIGAFIVILVTALSRTLLSPRFPAWRFLSVGDEQATHLRRLFNSLAVVFAIDDISSTVLLVLNASLELISLTAFVIACAFSALLFRLASPSLWRQRSEEPHDEIATKTEPTPGDKTSDEKRGGSSRGWLPLAAMALALAIPVAGALGYVPLARFIARQIVLTGGIILLAWMLRQVLQEVVAFAASARSAAGRGLRQSLALSDQSCDRLRFWVGLLLDAVLIFVFVPSVLLQWGVSRADMRNWLELAFFGFRIGDVTISLSNVLIALFLFGLFLSLTRLLQRSLGERLLPRTGMDKGIQDSLRIGVGYVGFIVAAAVGISQLGLDLSNLAIVAGALSVGIGFGLQSVVNNFVSGLILLVERPIKVGDWVVVGSEQGYVKRIKVRSTEIETFERASVIIPNSDLVSGTVKNWFHGNRIGRGAVNIGVSYDSDAEQVRQVLLDIANKEPMVARYPPPAVDFLDFGDSALMFRLRFFLNDMDYVLTTSSRMRFEILKRFREEGIGIPFPQRDLHIRSGLVQPAIEDRLPPTPQNSGDTPA